MLPDMYFKHGKSDYEGLYGLPPQDAHVLTAQCTTGFYWKAMKIPGIEACRRV